MGRSWAVWLLGCVLVSAGCLLAGELFVRLVIVAGLAIRLGMSVGWVEPGVANFTQLVVGQGSALFDAAGFSLSILFKLDLLLFVFNLIPVPPLDGSGALALFLPRTPRAACNRCSGGPSSPWWES